MGLTSTSKSGFSKEDDESKKSRVIQFAGSIASKSSKKNAAAKKLDHMVLTDEKEEGKRFSSVSGESFS